jgi:hypothetical protein
VAGPAVAPGDWGLYPRNPDPRGSRADPRETVKQLEGFSRLSGGDVGQKGEESDRPRPGEAEYRVTRAAVGPRLTIMTTRVSWWSRPRSQSLRLGPRSHPRRPRGRRAQTDRYGRPGRQAGLRPRAAPTSAIRRGSAGVNLVAAAVGGGERAPPRRRLRAVDRLAADPVDQATAAPEDRMERLGVVRRRHARPLIASATAAATSALAACTAGGVRLFVGEVSAAGFRASVGCPVATGCLDPAG